jgi:hypothetical protein
LKRLQQKPWKRSGKGFETLLIGSEDFLTLGTVASAN